MIQWHEGQKEKNLKIHSRIEQQNFSYFYVLSCAAPKKKSHTQQLATKLELC